MSAVIDETASATEQAGALIDAAGALIPGLLARGDEADNLRRLPDETVRDLEAAGLTKLTVPRLYGGRQASALECRGVMEQLARGCLSTSFVNFVYAANALLTCLLPDDAHDEVFLSDNPKGVAAFNPMSGTATPQGTDYRLSGRWAFCTGQHHAGWALLFAVVAGDGDVPEVGAFQVPRSELTSAGDWNVTGMAATGSDSLIAEKVLVPSHRVLLLSDILAGRYASSLVENDPYYRHAWLPFLHATLSGTPVGAAEAAMDLFSGRVHRRGITYTPYLRQADAAITHHHMAESRMKIDQAGFHGARLVDSVKSDALVLDLLTQARCRADISWALRLCREAIDIIEYASGASSIHRGDPLQRVVRDIRALSLHAIFLNTTSAELYGRVLCGLDPGVPLL